MKNLASIAALVLIVSCGKNEPLKQLGDFAHSAVKDSGSLLESVGQTPRALGRAALGIDDSESELEKKINVNSEAIAQINESLNALYDLIDDNQADQDAISQTVALNQSRLAALEANENITDIIDPCGDKANEFDEVVLKTQSGKFIAYFEDGGKRFLSLLPNGNYQTTDKQKCNFSISNGQLND